MFSQFHSLTLWHYHVQKLHSQIGDITETTNKIDTHRSEVLNSQQSNSVIIHTSHNAVTCLTSPQWCQCIINSLLVGMHVALKCSSHLVQIGFSFFCLKVTVTQQLFCLRNDAFWSGLLWHIVANKRAIIPVLGLPHICNWINVGLQCKTINLHA